MKSIYYLELFWYLDRFAKCFFVRYEKYWLSLNGFWSLRRQRFYCKWLIVSKIYFSNYSHVGLCEGFINSGVTYFIKIIWFEILFPDHNLVFAFCATFFHFWFLTSIFKFEAEEGNSYIFKWADSRPLFRLLQFYSSHFQQHKLYTWGIQTQTVITEGHLTSVQK